MVPQDALVHVGTGTTPGRTDPGEVLALVATKGRLEQNVESRRAEEKSEEINALEGLRDGSFLGFVSYAIGMVQIYPIRAACTGFVLVIVNMFVLRSLCDC